MEQLYGVKLEGIHPVQDFIFEPVTDNKLHIIYTGSTKYDPIYVVVAEKDSSTYSLNVKNAVQSNAFISKLTSDDQKILLKLGSMTPPKRNYSKLVFQEI